MTEQNFQNNWINNITHLLLQFGASWCVMFSLRRFFGEDYSIFMNKAFFYAGTTLITAIVYFFVFRRFALKVSLVYIIAGMFMGLYSMWGMFVISSSLSVDSQTEGKIMVIYTYISFCLPLVSYLLSYTNNKAFMALYIPICVIAFCSLPVLPMLIFYIIWGPLI